MILLDNGDINKDYGRQPELKYETAMKAMAEMGYVAANVGEQDLVLGVDYLKYVSDYTGIPLLSANIVDAAGEPVFEQFAMRKLQDGDRPATAAVVGVISTEFKHEIEATSPEIVVEEYDPALETLVTQLRGESDLLVLLAHMGEAEASEVAERFPQFDLIIASHSGDDHFAVTLMSGGVPIGFSGTTGMYVGMAEFSLAEGGAEFVAYSADKLDGTIADSPRMLGLLEDYQQMLRAEDILAAFPRTEHLEAKFVGNEKCGRCHSLSTYRFQKSKHNHAFEPIVEKGHDYDPECVQCHTVGFGFVSGFRSPDTTPDLKHVGCEDCHGPGSKHLENPVENQYGEVEKETCGACHNPENSPTFVYEERIKEIKHNSFFACSAKICHWLD